MRRQSVPLGKAAWATRWVSSGIARGGSGRRDMGRGSKGNPVRWSGTSPSAPDLRITPWEGGRWNSPPVSTSVSPRANWRVNIFALWAYDEEPEANLRDEEAATTS